MPSEDNSMNKDRVIEELIQVWRQTDNECGGHIDYYSKMKMRLEERFDSIISKSGSEVGCEPLKSGTESEKNRVIGDTKPKKITNDTCEILASMTEREKQLSELQCVILDAYNKIEDMLEEEREKHE